MNKNVKGMIDRIQKTTPPLQAGFRVNTPKNWSDQLTNELTKQLKLVSTAPGEVLKMRNASEEAQKAANDASLHYFLDEGYSAGSAICQGISDGKKIQRIFEAVSEFGIPCMIVSKFN